MNDAPILIFQMQRMGDLVLTFPLLAWLAELHPSHPLWVVGERRFFEPLMPLSPPVTYFDYGEGPDFQDITFHCVINLSHRREAAALAGKARGDAVFGPYLDERGRLLVKGDWQLYRASLPHNNRYNLFHWSDLNALDIVPQRLMARTVWPRARAGKHGGRIGLFLGASEAEKRPDAEFWSAAVRRLLRAGHKPVLLGGLAEASLGLAVASKVKAHALNLCGRFSVSALARFIAELDLLITPDTGPMHIAAWTGVPVLNLSLGPVNPWETGPFSPGHHVVRAALDCAGCWRCSRESALCKEMLTAGKVTALMETLPCPDGAFARREAAPNPAGGKDFSRTPSSPESDAACRLAAMGTREHEVPAEGLRSDGSSPYAASPHNPAGDAGDGRLAGLELLRTNRDSGGLYALETILRVPPAGRAAFAGADAEPAAARHALALFWKAWFGALFGACGEADLAAAWERPRREHPQEARRLREGAARLLSALSGNLRGSPTIPLGAPDFWQQAPPCLHPLSGYIQMYVQNSLGSRESLRHALSLLEKIAALPR